ncbi:hypothetical protein Ancab_008577 [Ancistrocladus abbreviatus]
MSLMIFACLAAIGGNLHRHGVEDAKMFKDRNGGRDDQSKVLAKNLGWVCAAVMCVVWKSRNDRMFNNKPVNKDKNIGTNPSSFLAMVAWSKWQANTQIQCRRFR